ncbi:GTP-sensing pleiotropic transcriptional regulator CodY [Thermodesulfitimonas autotrophica]|uniref:GTP-sensing pleiotropic transcriptional regulator CodY n=1 Tax=Thermodesulfitimonas autotrophica TaxID=1894989 RepID=UPI000F4E5BFC|nr:GTP-sensing pleiotropic transcriptional regulator CodY [Thermodesulfitimonas autotrophica]
METLLRKARVLNGILQKKSVQYVDFGAVAAVLSELIRANVYLVDDQGKILGYAFMAGFSCRVISGIIQDAGFPPKYNKALLEVTETKANFHPEANTCIFNPDTECSYLNLTVTVVPILGAGARLGTLVLAKFNRLFSTSDLILAEHGATVVGMEIFRSRMEKMAQEARKRAAVQVALGSLSYSELDAARHVFAELGGQEGFLVASKIADKAGITRSVIVNALRKFESAGVVETRSLGMKGTYIRILNDYLLDELQHYKHV